MIPSREERACRDLDKLEVWEITSHEMFNRVKCCILHLGQSNPGCMYRSGNERLQSRAVERDLGVLLNSKLDMSQQSPGRQEGQWVLGCIRHSITSQAREGIVLLCSALGQPHLECWGQFWASQYKKDSKLLECIHVFWDSVKLEV